MTLPPNPTVLLVAFHFPPVQGSSGLQRTLRFAQHLPRFGWQPIVLTIARHAYESVADTHGNEVPVDVKVVRAFGLDAARHLSLFGRYPRRLALPDRWATWRRFALRRARSILARQPIAAIWSTFPIATAHEIGLAIATDSGLPWIAEFRDPMWQGNYPPDPVVNRAWHNLERRVFERADRVVVTTPSAVDLYVDRFKTYPRSQIVQVDNGYDEETFARATPIMPTTALADRADRRPLTLLHSGVVYPSERDPTQLFHALASLKTLGVLTANDLQIVLRASGHERTYERDIVALGIDDIVHLKPGVTYLQALQEMLSADGLLLLQASNCNAQIPAKLYEYLRAGRPILALTDPAGDTARTLKSVGAGFIARLDSIEEIQRAIPQFIDGIRNGVWRQPSCQAVSRFSRQKQAGQLAELLDQLTTRKCAGKGPSRFDSSRS